MNARGKKNEHTHCPAQGHTARARSMKQARLPRPCRDAVRGWSSINISRALRPPLGPLCAALARLKTRHGFSVSNPQLHTGE